MDSTEKTNVDPVPDDHAEGDQAVSDANQPAEDESLCKNCKEREYRAGFLTPLCVECREAFTRFPIPRWLTFFGIALLLVVIVTAYRIPTIVSCGIDLARADKAMEARKYRTAQKLLVTVQHSYPENIETNGKMLVACVKNMDMQTAIENYVKIESKTFKNDHLLSQINSAMSHLESILPPDSLVVLRIEAAKDSVSQLLAVFFSLNKTEGIEYASAGFTIASYLYALEDYDDAEVVVKSVLEVHSDHDFARLLLCAIKRQQGDLTSATEIGFRMLNENLENVSVLAQFAKIEMKRGDDVKAAKYVDQAMKLGEGSIEALEVRGMLDYLSGDERSSRAMVQKIRSMESSSSDGHVSARLENMINGVTKYR